MRKYLLLFAFVANTTFAQNIQNIEKLSEFKDRFLENPFESIRLLKGNVKSFKQTYMEVENFNKFEIFSDSIPENNHARDKYNRQNEKYSFLKRKVQDFSLSYFVKTTKKRSKELQTSFFVVWGVTKRSMATYLHYLTALYLSQLLPPSLLFSHAL